uniref:Uncharacterized protein n=1 Tax=Acrobeloides nanus TaxID=290746 RepID=A0A914DC87_9BILA
MDKKRMLIDTFKNYVQEVREKLSIILNYNSDKHDSSWNQINGTRNFDFYEIKTGEKIETGENFASYFIAVKVGELGETFFATAFKLRKKISISTFRRHYEVKWHDHPPITNFLRCYYHMLECQPQKVYSDSPYIQ